MRTQISPSTMRAYPLTMICQVYRLARSTVYTTKPRPALTAPQKRGPKTVWGDPALLEAIQAVLAACPFYGEGYRKIDHHTDEVMGWHAAKRGDRWAALQPIRQGIRAAFNDFAKEIARGLRVRCDWGPQYVATAWIQELKWLGITISPSYVGEPQCNGVAERFMRTLKEQCLYLHQFDSLAQAQQIIGEFITRYNTQWLIERLGHRTPAQARAEAQSSCAA
jgi:putative transposase